MSIVLVQGVVKSLFQQDLLPRVISGSSVGSIGESEAGWPRILKLLHYSSRRDTKLV